MPPPHFGVEFIGGRARGPGRVGSSQVLGDEQTGRRVRTEPPRFAHARPQDALKQLDYPLPGSGLVLDPIGLTHASPVNAATGPNQSAGWSCNPLVAGAN